MIRTLRLDHRFVETMPITLEQGVLYVSMPFGTAIHRCCCGCGHEVVTPFSPTDWKMTFDGETVSLWPSIGNWNLPCRTHYIIDRNHIVVAGDWTAQQVANERQRDRSTKRRHYAQQNAVPAQSPQTLSSRPPGQSVWRRFKKWWSGDMSP